MLLDSNKKQNKNKTKNKHSLKDCVEQFFIFSYKNITHDKTIFFHAALLVQKSTIWAGYAEQSIK